MLIASLIFCCTLALVITQPRSLPIGWIALSGAALALLTGVVHWKDVPEVWQIVWDATFTLIGLITISLVLDAAGFFAWAALSIARRARGRGTALFFALILLGAATAALLANDGAVLILTPIVLEMLHALRFSPRALLAFAFATGFIADAASLPLKISNLTNIVVANYFGISFAAYAEVMVVVNLAAVAASLAVLWLVFRRDVPARFDTSALRNPREAIRDAAVVRTGIALMPLLLLGYVASHTLGMAASAITGVGAATLIAVAARRHFLRRQPKGVIPLGKLLREAPWQVVIFSLGMYLVVFGLRNQGLTAEIARLLEWSAGHGNVAATVVTGGLFAAVSAVMNNMPTVLVGSLAIQEASVSGMVREATIYANVIGCNLGPKMTPIGSLATLLWLHVLRARGINISWWQYCRTGVVLTLPVLAVTLLALVGWLTLLR